MSLFGQLDKERLLSMRLRDHGVRIFEGQTDVEERKRRMREAIEQVGAAVICGRDKNGRPMTYEAAFLSTYGEPLTPAHAKPASSTGDRDAGKRPESPG